MKPSQIIKQYAQDAGLDTTKALVTVQYILTHGLGFLLKKKDTVVLLIRISPHVYEAHIATQDSPVMLTRAMTSIFKDIKKLKIKRMYGNANNYQIILLMKRIIDRVGGKIDFPDKQGYNWMIIV